LQQFVLASAVTADDEEDVSFSRGSVRQSMLKKDEGMQQTLIGVFLRPGRDGDTYIIVSSCVMK